MKRPICKGFPYNSLDKKICLADQAWRQIGEFLQQLISGHGLSQHRLTIAVYATELKNVFCQINTQDTVWHVDLTYIPTAEGWLYLAAIKDQCTCKIVG